MNGLAVRLRGPSRAAGWLVALVLLLPVLSARAAVDIQEVASDRGVTAWLVEDYTVPVISVRFAFRGGSTQDPAGMEGMSQLMSGLFDEGAGAFDRAAFQDRLDEAGAEMRFRASPDAISGSMRMLSAEREAAFALLAEAVNAPRFDPGPVERIRAQILSSIEAQSRNPETEADIAWARAIYGDHPYARSEEGTAQSLGAIERDDLQAFHRRMFARDNLVVAVVGAIDAQTLKRELDRVFGGLPAEAGLDAVARVEPKLDQRLRVDYTLPQASIRLAFPGIERSDPQFFAAYLMNEILGGGTFSSRLFDEVRERRGLSYGIGSWIANRDHASMLVIGTSTRADRVEETLEIIRAVVGGMAENGPTQDELDKVKAYVKGAYAINNLDTSASIARTLVQLQMDGLGIDYIERRQQLIDAVTLDDARAAARRLLSAEPAIMIVGAGTGDGTQGD